MEIIKRNTRIEVIGYKLGYCPKLEGILSVWNKQTFSYSFKAFKYIKKSEKLILPSGISISYLKNLLGDEDIPVIYKEKSDFPEGSKVIFNMKSHLKDEVQRESYRFLKRALIEENNPEAILNLKTGKGKTLLSIYFLSAIKTKAVIIADMKRLIDQWKEEILKHTNLSKYDIYIIDGKRSIEKLLKEKNPKYKIYIASHRTLFFYMKECGKNSLNKLFDYMKIGVKIYDEAHTEWENIFNINLYTNVTKTIYLTATLGRSNYIEDRVYQIIYKDIPKYNGISYGTSKIEEDEPYQKICYVNFSSNAPKFLSRELRSVNSYGMNVAKYSDYCFTTAIDTYLKVIYKVYKLIEKKEGKTAIILYKNDHIKLVRKFLDSKFPYKSIGVFTSLVHSDKKAEQLDNDIILTTYGSLGKALNIENLKYIISLLPTSSKIVVTQLIGRLRPGSNGIYFDLCDVSIQQCYSQRKSREKILNKLAKKIFTLKI